VTTCVQGTPAFGVCIWTWGCVNEREFWGRVDALVDSILSTQAWKTFSRAAIDEEGESHPSAVFVRVEHPVYELLRIVEEQLREIFADDPFYVRAETRPTCATHFPTKAVHEDGNSSLELFGYRNI